MRPIIVPALIALLLTSCKGGSNTPNVSDVRVELATNRFEQDLFALDTVNIRASYAALLQKYPGFLPDFMNNILGLPPDDPEAILVLKKFIGDFHPIKKAVDDKFGDFSRHTQEVEQMLKYVKHYFPQYALPTKLITFIGPMDAFYEASLGWTGDIITTSGLGVGLQMHLGAESAFYMQEGGQGYPSYISRRFGPEYIVVNCARNVIDDLYPDRTRELALVDQMVDKGKRLYILDRLLPEVADTLKIGYTKAQLEGCRKNEALIWNMFTSNELLFEKDYQKIKTFVGEGPSTMELGEDSPGYIALFTGKRVVETFMENNPQTSLADLIGLDNRKLYEASKYKPK